MKRIVRLTESDLARIVKRVIKEGDRFNDWASQGIGSANYDRDMEYLRKRREEDEIRKMEYEKNYGHPNYDPKTGSEWTPESLSNFIYDKYGLEIPEEYMDSVVSIKRFLYSM